MKQAFVLIAFTMIFAMTSCNVVKDEVVNPEASFFEISEVAFDVDAKGGEVSTIVFSNRDWKISGGYDWCRPSAYSGTANQDGTSISFIIDATDETRSATFWFRSRDKQIRFTINQFQIDTINSKSDTIFEIPVEGGYVDIVYEANVECEVIIPEDDRYWIQFDTTRALEEKIITLIVSENTRSNSRSAEIKVVSTTNALLQLTYVITQKGADVVDNPTVALSTTSLNFAQKGGSQMVDVEANSDWRVEYDADWVTVTPEHGNKSGVITVTVSKNYSSAVRSATIKVIAIHKEYGDWETKRLTVLQSADSKEALLYSDNFDGKESTKTYGSGSSWPYIDQFPEFANAEGEAAATVTYSGSGVTVRSNERSNGTYSDYDGSGYNNIFFGTDAYFQINDIAPFEGVNFKVTFGAEKYTQNGDSTFRSEEFLMYISKNGTTWTPVEYVYAGAEPGRWNDATANFTLNAEVEKLYIKFEAKVASVYRLDDVTMDIGNGGQLIEL